MGGPALDLSWSSELIELAVAINVCTLLKDKETEIQRGEVNFPQAQGAS